MGRVGGDGQIRCMIVEHDRSFDAQTETELAHPRAEDQIRVTFRAGVGDRVDGF